MGFLVYYISDCPATDSGGNLDHQYDILKDFVILLKEGGVYGCNGVNISRCDHTFLKKLNEILL